MVDFAQDATDGDWAPAIQAAIDSGKSVVYFPAEHRYTIKSDVVVRGNVRTFFGGSPKTTITGGAPDAPESGPAVVFDRSVPIFDTEMLLIDHVRHQHPSTFVVRHGHVDHISTGSETGDLFIEDSPGKWRFDENQSVWGRQMNPETKGIPEIINDGGSFWVLGSRPNT